MADKGNKPSYTDLMKIGHAKKEDGKTIENRVTKNVDGKTLSKREHSFEESSKERGRGAFGKFTRVSGGYTESTGGGTPLKKGEKLKDHPEADRVDQPRDAQGHFAENAANSIPLKYESRGTTVPVILRESKVEIGFAVKSGNMRIKLNGKWYKMKDENAETLINTFKEYSEQFGFKAYDKKVAGQQGNPEWLQKGARTATGSDSARYIKEGGTFKIVAKGSAIDFIQGFKKMQDSWKTLQMKPKHARNARKKYAHVERLSDVY